MISVPRSKTLAKGASGVGLAAALLSALPGSASAGICNDLVPAAMTAAELQAAPLATLERAATACSQAIAAQSGPIDADDIRLLQLAYERVLERTRLIAVPAPPAQREPEPLKSPAVAAPAKPKADLPRLRTETAPRPRADPTPRLRAEPAPRRQIGPAPRLRAEPVRRAAPPVQIYRAAEIRVPEWL